MKKSIHLSLAFSAARLCRIVLAPSHTLDVSRSSHASQDAYRELKPVTGHINDVRRASIR